MSQTPTTPVDHPIATAIGKTLGTIAKATGLGPEPPAPQKRLPRKLKKQLKKSASASIRKQQATKQTAKKRTRKSS